MQLKPYILSLFLILCSFDGFSVYRSGLFFSSFEVDQDKRTSLHLTPDENLELTNGFTMQFDVRFRRLDQNFGYVFRMIGQDNINLDFISDISSNESVFSLVSGSKSLIQIRRSELKNFDLESWRAVKVSYNAKSKLLSLDINNLHKRGFFETKKMLNNVDVFFGVTKHAVFATTDVPPMTIKNIRFLSGNNELIRNWKLEKHATNKVYDECKRVNADVLNPVWQIDEHVKWRNSAHFVLPSLLPQIAFNDVDGRVYFAKGNKIVIYDVVSKSIDSITAIKGVVFNNMANQLVYDKKSKKLISYSFENNKLAYFDFQKREWTNENTKLLTSEYWHHNKFFNIEDSSLITFGGYGYHTYKANIMKYSLKNKGWQKNDIALDIQPRYLGSLGSLGKNELLYFGGYGSKTGKQEEFPHNFYDLYNINTKTLEVKKIWEMNDPTEHFTNSNSLIINKEKRVFYNLSYANTEYSTCIKLMEYSMDKPEFKIVGDTLPYKFKDIESYCDLFYFALTSEFIAVTSVSKNKNSEINIYSIAYPPLQTEDVLQNDDKGYLIKWFYLVGALGLVFLGSFLIFKKRKKKIEQSNLNDSVSTYDYYSLEAVLNPSSVNLLGGFSVVDSSGVDISGSFSPTLRHLLVVIILFTVNNKQGVTSHELTSILWPEKDHDSARNNRNVNFNKLRVLLKKVGEIELTNRNNYWFIQFGKGAFCDYINVMHHIEFFGKKADLNIEKLDDLIINASRGVLLPSLSEEWLDNFKSNYTNSLIESLVRITTKEKISGSFNLLLKISDIILLHDNIDEDAAKLKVYALYNLGKIGQAKQFYEKFAENYRDLMSVSYKDTFDQFLKTSI